MSSKKYHADYYQNVRKRVYEANKEAINAKTRKRWAERCVEDPLKMFIYSIRGCARAKKLKFDLDKEHIEELWLKQNGKCYYTGVDMVFGWRTNSPYQISADRLIPVNGYQKGNIVLCCKNINFAKGDLPVNEFIKFLDTIKNTSSQFKSQSCVDSVNNIIPVGKYNNNGEFVLLGAKQDSKEVTESPYCDFCGKRLRMKGDGSICQLCEC